MHARMNEVCIRSVPFMVVNHKLNATLAADTSGQSPPASPCNSKQVNKSIVGVGG